MTIGAYPKVFRLKPNAAEFAVIDTRLKELSSRVPNIIAHWRAKKLISVVI